jgi:hypothetical protein
MLATMLVFTLSVVRESAVAFLIVMLHPMSLFTVVFGIRQTGSKRLSLLDELAASSWGVIEMVAI